MDYAWELACGMEHGEELQEYGLKSFHPESLSFRMKTKKLKGSEGYGYYQAKILLRAVTTFLFFLIFGVMRT